ncbi:UTP--glucose-1-phosphate uridylyltransferase GalU [Paenibacillus sp. WLX1005]|uniref:UTP--glucose-1-phosphate uridylyltransferase GalU n=1 Tax=Paenibacillus sp. WLX1005 TaxID=3243766 RepID=UPI003983ED48
MKVRKAIIPAAGLGTRLLPATKAQPKEMLPIVDKPAIQYIIEEAVASGIESILIVTGRGKRSIEDHFDHSVELELELATKNKTALLEQVNYISEMADIHYIRQKKPLGLGHAILCAKQFVGNEPFAVLLGDDLIVNEEPGLKQLINQTVYPSTAIVGVQHVPYEETNKYGIVAPSALPNTPHSIIPLSGIVEKPDVADAPSDLAVIGRYILPPEIFDILEDTPPGKGGEIQLTDAISRLPHLAALEIQGNRYDIGDPLGYVKSTIEFALNRPELRGEIQKYLEELYNRSRVAVK